MNTEHLIKMANQIATFFQSMPDPNEAEQGLVNHIQKFWDPRMRQELVQAINQQTLAQAASSSSTLHPLVVRAAKLVRL